MVRLACMLLSTAVALCGCATEKMSGDQLARVAKDWSLSIRASQVIPVYPLTEDLQPGDVFLVQTPIEEQVKVYLDKGFLPLENLVARLPLTGYAEFYRGWPKIGDGIDAPPRPWQFPTAEAADADFSHAPLAAFPTYNFSVSRSGGLSVAIPVQSVPVGLNLLDSASANGTITLKDAYTYALPARRTYDAIHTWSRDNADYLKQFEPTTPAQEGKVATKAQEFYLRVINRVYLVKAVDVSLFSNRAASAAGSAGVPQPVQLLNIANANTDAAKQFEAINQILANAGSAAPAAPANAGAVTDAGGMPPPVAVGGSIKLAMATSRSVSFVETFRRPLVIGYLASDYAILKGGMLAAPTPTFSMLEGRPLIVGQAIPYQGCDADCLRIRPWLKLAGNQAKLESWLQAKGGSISIADLLTGNHADLRRNVVKELIEGSN
jgi:hypothetical protein